MGRSLRFRSCSNGRKVSVTVKVHAYGSKAGLTGNWEVRRLSGAS